MRSFAAGLLVLAVVSGCAPEAQPAAEAVASASGTWLEVQPAERANSFDATGVAEPYEEATLSTKLMGTVTAVRVREGDAVRAGTVLAEIDARELTAQAAGVAASVAAAEAMQREATTQAQRMRALFAEDAAPRAQLDAAETGLARADAAVSAARAGASELAAVSTYARITAPFSGTVIRRSVDPGAFASPGTPLLTIQDASRLRVSVTVPPAVARRLRRGDVVSARIEDVPANAVVEGVVPAGGSLYTVNAIVDNRAGEYLAGSAASLALSQGTRSSLVLPRGAIRHEGDLTGVLVRTGQGTELRFVRLGRVAADSVEVLAGLRAGEQVQVPGAVEVK